MIKMERNEPTTDSWDGFLGEFLKPVNVKNEEDAFVVLNVEVAEEGDSPRPRLILEKDNIEYKFDLNKTNMNFLINAGIKSPKSLIGSKINFKKALVRNPKTNLEQEGLRICKVMI